MKTEILVFENFADDEILLRAVDREDPRFAVSEVAVDARKITDVVGIKGVIGPAGLRIADPTTFVAETLFHRHPEVPPVR